MAEANNPTPTCKHSQLRLDECDEHGTGLDYYVCVDCGAEFEGGCEFLTYGDPFRIPSVGELRPIK